ncbi:MAG: hypothetical protein UDK36_04745 [Bacteroidaceae bacterium]|nr:hypothetical protein [Bacteroidaceae bacterium]
MEKNIYLIDSRSTKQQAVIDNFVKTSILNDIVKKTYNLWNNLKTVCLNNYANKVSLNSGMKKICLNSEKEVSLNSCMKEVCLNSKKEVYLNSKKEVYLNSEKEISLNSCMKKVCRPIEWLCSYYSDVLERKLTMRQTWLLINAQLAFGAAFFPVEAPWVIRIGCLVWVVSALLKCKREIK